MNFSDPFLILAIVFALLAVGAVLWALASQRARPPPTPRPGS